MQVLAREWPGSLAGVKLGEWGLCFLVVKCGENISSRSVLVEFSCRWDVFGSRQVSSSLMQSHGYETESADVVAVEVPLKRNEKHSRQRMS